MLTSLEVFFAVVGSHVVRISITVGLLSTMLLEDSSIAVYQAKSWRMLFVICAVNTCSVAEIKIYLVIVRRWIRPVRFLLSLGWVKHLKSGVRCS